MEDVIGILIVAAVVLFAVYKTFPDDHPLKKAAVVVIGALAVLWDKITAIIQGLG